MGKGKRQGEQELKKVLKKLRTTQNKEQNSPLRRKLYGPARPENLPQERAEIGPEIPDFLKARQEEEEEEDFVGPEAPEELDQVQSHSEIERILKVSEKAGTLLDPYEVLDVDSEKNEYDIKKAFRKKSLAVHPDKANHPDAHKAFQILKEAWKQIQTSEGRQEWETKKAKHDHKKDIEIDLRKEERQREWEAAMNPGMHPRKESGRQEWMTQLPELRRQPQRMKQVISFSPQFLTVPQVNQTNFSQKEYVDVSKGASSWTNQPAPCCVSAKCIESSQRVSVRRNGKSLLEKHIERQKSNSNEKRRQNNETDSLLKSTGSLHDRFE